MNTQLNWTQWLFHTLKGQLVLAGLAIVATYLITEHTAHVVQVLPYAFLLLCPLLHLFLMKHGHTNHSDHTDSSNGKR